MELTSVGQTSKKSDRCGLNSSNAKGRKWGVGGGLACVGSGREREREGEREKERKLVGGREDARGGVNAR